ncbi:hypothetical protein Q4512_03345 [Oceanihabitans sp. 2_MG-2023]|uniref:hypothetical protein n=1 Tax=Oceanihabitans sp. 2_MG-2023 TaxID=3062661 RepID=UPI0026E3A361|nr:hypothetical protein [Oceanihabitans sp. 2_MG-2023]MDO6595934.1 hypothetical protein [Oceanihabitans sp. 2_MG-2023]
MSDKKHIDRIFQEKLKDLEISPSPKVWKNIQGKIEQPKEETKKAFPIWLRITSIAALLLILLTVGNLYTSSKTNTKEIHFVDTENTINTAEPQKKNLNIENTNNAMVDESANALKKGETILETKNTSKENTGIATSNTSNTSKSKNSNNNKTVINKKQNSYATTQNRTTQNPLVVTKKNTPISTKSENATANNSNRNPNVISNKNETKKYQTNTVISNTNSKLLAQNTSKKRSNTIDNIAVLDKNKVDSELKKNSANAVTENLSNTEEENKTTDAETKVEETSIEEEIAKAEERIEKEEEEEKVNRWQVYANIAPVYYNTLGKGSHIDEQFVDNSKSGETNTSYGVNVSYAFNKKLKLRSGVNSLNLSYDTDNVIIYQNVSGNNAATLKNVDFNNEQSISAISATNLGVQQAVGLLPNENAAISQRLGYYEIPMELEYTVSSKKFGVNVIAGLSTFILNDNKIYSEFEGRKTEIGEANNINDVSFSGNLGLGLDYKFSNKIKFNVQPTFKYQMNAFENTSGNFRPYIIGVYTGLSYKF